MGEVKGEAVFLPPRTAVGSPIDPADLSDWIIEIDNKSLTHRPDLWGHYGIARELAAMLGLKLKKYPVTPLAKLQDASLPEIPIEIDDPVLCRRYSGLTMTGLKAQPAPLWMQAAPRPRRHAADQPHRRPDQLRHGRPRASRCTPSMATRSTGSKSRSASPPSASAPSMPSSASCPRAP